MADQTTSAPAVPQIELVTKAKPWYISKTMLFNLACIALATAESQLNVLQPLLPMPVWQLAAFVLPVVNAMLRVITSSGVRL
jgi:hypothetical protein